METALTKTTTKMLLIMLKDFTSAHTTTSLARATGITRVGAWKALRQLASASLVTAEAIGRGKTSAAIARLSWDNPLLEKALVLALTEESMRQRRWRSNFAELEGPADFTIVYGSILSSPQAAHDIDLLGIISRKDDFPRFQDILLRVQRTQAKHIHCITLTPQEFALELRKRNPAVLDAVRTGTVLFGQEQFVAFMRGRAQHADWN